MKKLTIFIIVFLSIQLLPGHLARAVYQSPKVLPAVVNPTPVDQAVLMKKQDEYQLPYAGLLPDNPLYFLKSLRDAIFDKLLVDPVRKADFYILQADKRLSTGMTLVDKGNWPMAKDVISKGENYTEKAIVLLQSIKSSGRETQADLLDKLERSMNKHVEVLTGLLSKATGEAQTSLQGTLQRVRLLQVRVGNLR